MSLCINNDLIWVSVPRCASTSIELSFLESKLNVNHVIKDFIPNKTPGKIEPGNHIHFSINNLYENFGLKESICIKRNYVDRWLSSLRYVWNNMIINGVEPIIKWEEIDNNFIYEMFTKDYIDNIHNTFGILEDNTLNEDSYFDKESIINLNYYFSKKSNIKSNKFKAAHFLFYSQIFWKNNKKCTYEFDIKEIYKFEEFISNRYSIDFKVSNWHYNKSKNIPNKIVVDNTLEEWIFNNFEKRFEKRNHII